MTEKLPVPPGAARWSPNRKRAVAEAVRKGDLTRERAREAYSLSDDELDAWLAGRVFSEKLGRIWT